eukprot:scaffold2150_cov137-Isochrysis_galbana.AAC.13
MLSLGDCTEEQGSSGEPARSTAAPLKYTPQTAQLSSGEHTTEHPSLHGSERSQRASTQPNLAGAMAGVTKMTTLHLSSRDRPQRYHDVRRCGLHIL